MDKVVAIRFASNKSLQLCGKSHLMSVVKANETEAQQKHVGTMATF